ncbi:glycosyl transferase [Flavobacterium lutivivi]|nr:glycosyl transferase [Flavobacterium lutivivi]
MNTKNILVAPLNWGLGHAARCIPLIKELINQGYTPVLASDGNALNLLKKEFPNLIALELPSYEIEYAKKAKNFKWKLLKNSPKTINAIIEEKKLVKKWCEEYDLAGIISDNRLGVYNKKVPSVIITHQLRVLSGKTTWISSKLHQRFIKKFNECWVPDFEKKPNLTGKLGHLKDASFTVKYLGPLSRLNILKIEKKYDLMIILSGPEPQRTLLEDLLIKKIRFLNKKILFVKGLVSDKQVVSENEHITFYNFMTSAEIEKAFNESEIILCRSGYTTIMDLVKLNKKAFLIPTPGQTEQEYLARRLKKNGHFPYSKQEDFEIEMLDEIDFYKPFLTSEKEQNWKQLFVLFERE